MHTPPQITLARYYKSFASISGVLAAATSVGPIVSVFLPGGASPYIFPPLGDVTMPARLGAVALAVAITYFAFYSVPPSKGVFRRFLWFGGVALISLCSYLFCFSHFVRKIDVPATDSHVSVGIGYERTRFAIQTFDSESDWDMLRARGTSEEEVSRLWTARSLDISRLCLFASYCGFVLPLVLAFSLGVRYQM